MQLVKTAVMMCAPVPEHRSLTAGLKAMTRVLVTRPEPGATRTLNALIARGIDAIAIPLTEISPLAFEAPPGGFDALIITSQNAIIHGASLLSGYISKPVFAVGNRTAEILRGRGHLQVFWAETAQQMLPLIITCAPKSLLYICGQTRRTELETALTKANIHVHAVEVYSAPQTPDVSAKLVVFFSASSNPIILFHAPSAAEAFSLAMKGQNLPVSTHLLCMSAAISAQLPETWQSLVIHAHQPDDAAMIEQLDKILAQHHLRQA
jgi:uroporphyrinogen-III synthase